MGQIVRLSEYRKAGATRRPGTSRGGMQQQTLASPPHYFCLRCDTDQFKLFPGGTVHCSHCGALMRNITVSDKGSS
jgi:hypothetical protein